MPESGDILRQLPRVDDLLADPRIAPLAGENRPLAREAVREAVDQARQAVLAGRGASGVSVETIVAEAVALFRRKSTRSLRRAVNAAGVILHTNLGRAPLSPTAAQAVADVVAGYCNVQAGLESGERTPRENHVQELLQRITGAEACLVVNNNAAATVLVLNTLAAGREVILSRGEMVEIGGSFRIPDIMKLSGCRLVEVGCTNRTHLADYERAITPATGLILSIHQSNYRIEGFAGQTSITELAGLAKSKGLPCAHDLGSGALTDLRAYGLPTEPNVPESLAAGADAVFFSGDKLLGGPQCGIILGKAALLQSMRKNPFYRAFRVCKLTLAALEGTLRLFLDMDRIGERHRVMAMLTASPQALEQRAVALAHLLNERCGGWLRAETAPGESEIGGGSLAGHKLPSTVVRLTSARIAAAELSRRMRLSDPPVFPRVHEDAVLLDPRTLLAGEESVIADVLDRIGRAL